MVCGDWNKLDWLNYFSSVFNLMNVAIGSGIIGLGYVANTMGYVPYIGFNVFVSVMSIFTLNIVCECSTIVYKWADENPEKRKDKVVTNDIEKSNRDEGDLKDDGSDQSYLMKSNEKGLNGGLKDPDAYVNAYSYEEIANILFGKWALIINNLCILFYLFSCQCSYMTLIKQTMPSIVQGLGRLWGSADFELDWETSIFTTGDILLLVVLCIVLIPLGFAKRIDFLGFTSAIGMFAMISFVMMIVMKQSSIAEQCGSVDYPLNGTKFNHDIETECEIKPVNLSLTSLKSMGICVFAYLSHCNVLAIFAEVRGKSRAGVLKRMEQVVLGAIVPCTILYLTAAMFAYKSFFNHTQAQLIQLYSFIQQDGNLILYCNILVITCIVFSIPLAQYPARSAIWNLIHTLAPPSMNFPVPFTPKELDIKEKADQRTFPWIPFLSIMLAQYAVIFSIVWSDADFGLFLSLAGAISGSTVVMIFPASFWLHIDGWKLMQSKTKFKNAFCYFILGFGFVTLFGNTSIIIAG